MTLYDKTKRAVYKRIPKHSAYRSGVLVKEYKQRFREKYGTRRQPYLGKKATKKGLGRWFREKWANQRGEIGYKHKSDIYRPTRRVTAKTPVTHKELSAARVRRARRTKRIRGRVARF